MLVGMINWAGQGLVTDDTGFADQGQLIDQENSPGDTFCRLPGDSRPSLNAEGGWNGIDVVRFLRFRSIPSLLISQMTMSLRTLLLLAITIILHSQGALAERQEEELQLKRLVRGDLLVVTTKERVYQLELIDPARGTCLARVSLDQGQTFTSRRLLHVLGASQAARDNVQLRLVEMGRVRVGRRLEIGLGSLSAQSRCQTGIVRSLELRPAR